MAVKSDPDMGINSWLEEELYQQYLHDRSAVDESWKDVFEANGAPKPASSPGAVPPGPASVRQPAPVTALADAAGEWQPLRGAAGKIAENMAASLAIPLATSQRVIAVKVMDENRRIINQHRTLLHQNKVSYTHILGWAVVKALAGPPAWTTPTPSATGSPIASRGARSTLASRSMWPRRMAGAASSSPISRMPARRISTSTRRLSTIWWRGRAPAS